MESESKFIVCGIDIAKNKKLQAVIAGVFSEHMIVVEFHAKEVHEAIQAVTKQFKPNTMSMENIRKEFKKIIREIEITEGIDVDVAKRLWGIDAAENVQEFETQQIATMPPRGGIRVYMRKSFKTRGRHWNRKRE